MIRSVFPPLACGKHRQLGEMSKLQYKTVKCKPESRNQGRGRPPRVSPAIAEDSCPLRAGAFGSSHVPACPGPGVVGTHPPGIAVATWLCRYDSRIKQIGVNDLWSPPSSLEPTARNRSDYWAPGSAVREKQDMFLGFQKCTF